MKKIKDNNNPAGLNLTQRLSFLFKDSMLYGGADAFGKAFTLITFPILTRHFSVSEYGLFDIFMVAAAMLGSFFVFGQDSAVARFFYEYEKKRVRKEIISLSLFYQFSWLIFIIPIVWIFSDKIGPLLSDAKSSQNLLKLILLQVPFLVLINFSINLLKWTFSRTKFLIISIGISVFKVTALVIGIKYYNISVQEALLIILGVVSIFGILGFLFIRKWLVLPKSTIYLNRLIRYAAPLGIIAVTGAFVPVMERSLVNSLVGSIELGLYAAGSKIAFICMLLVGAFQTAWGPFSLSIYKQNDAITTYNMVLKAFTTLMCMFVLVLSAVATPFIILLSSAEYSAASVIVFPLAMGIVIKAVSWITEVGISFSKKSHLNIYNYSVFIIVTLSGIYIFTSYYGMLGVALGVLAGHIGKSLTASFLSFKAYPLAWNYRGILLLLCITLIMGIIGLILNNLVPQYIISIYYVSCTILVFIISMFKVFSKEDRIKIYSQLIDIKERNM